MDLETSKTNALTYSIKKVIDDSKNNQQDIVLSLTQRSDKINSSLKEDTKIDFNKVEELLNSLEELDKIQLIGALKQNIFLHQEQGSKFNPNIALLNAILLKYQSPEREDKPSTTIKAASLQQAEIMNCPSPQI